MKSRLWLVATVSVATLTVSAPTNADPVSLTDDALATVVGGSIIDGEDSSLGELARLGQQQGGVVNAGDGNVDVDETHNVHLNSSAQRDATGLEIFNASGSNIGSGININVESPGEGGIPTTTNSTNTVQDLDQANFIGLSSAAAAHADELRNNTTVTNTGIATSDQSSSSGNVSTGSIDVDIFEVIEVSVPTGNGFFVGGDASLDIQSVDISIGGEFDFSGPSLNVDIVGGGCFVTGGSCDAFRTNDISAMPDAVAVSVPQSQGTGLDGEVISLGNGSVSISKSSEVVLEDDAQRNATGLKIVNAASSLIGSGVNISVNRCCKVNLLGGTRNITQRNVVFGQY